MLAYNLIKRIIIYKHGTHCFSINIYEVPIDIPTGKIIWMSFIKIYGGHSQCYNHGYN